MFRLTAFTDYVSPVDRANRDERRRRARFWREARKAERGQRFMLRFRVPFLILALVLAAVGWGCNEGDTIYQAACKPPKPDEWGWDRVALSSTFDAEVTIDCQAITAIVTLSYSDTQGNVPDGTWCVAPILRLYHRVGEWGPCDVPGNFTPWYAATSIEWDGDATFVVTLVKSRASLPITWQPGDGVGVHLTGVMRVVYPNSSTVHCPLFDPTWCDKATAPGCNQPPCRDCPDPNENALEGQDARDKSDAVIAMYHALAIDDPTPQAVDGHMPWCLGSWRCTCSAVTPGDTTATRRQQYGPIAYQSMHIWTLGGWQGWAY